MWVEKYKPKSVDEIVGNQDIIKEMNEWFQNYRKKDPKLKRGVLLCGPPGVGKTLIAQLVSQHNGFLIHEFNASDVRSKKSLQATMSELASSVDVMEFFLKKRPKPRPHAIIMEEVDGMATGDYGGLGEIVNVIDLKQVKKSWNAPIICTSNMERINKLKKLMRHCYMFQFDPPEEDDMLRWLQHIMKLEDISISIKSQKSIVEKAGHDYRQMINLLEAICVPFINSEVRTIPDKAIKSAMKTFGDKFKSLGLQDAMLEIVNSIQRNAKCMTVGRGVAIYYMDRHILPESIHENYLKWFTKGDSLHITDDIKEDDLVDIDASDASEASEASEVSEVDTMIVRKDDSSHYDSGIMGIVANAAEIFSARDFQFPLNDPITYDLEIQNIVGVYSINMPINVLRMTNRVKKKIPKLDHPRQFSNLITLKSQEKIKKEIHSVNTSMLSSDVTLEYMRRFIIQWFKDEDYDSLIKFMYDYEILPEHLLLFLRVRFFFGEARKESEKKFKKILSAKVQKKIESLFEEHNDEMWREYRLIPIDVRHESRRVVSK